jgi:ABC-2 type transport system permease protein
MVNEKPVREDFNKSFVPVAFAQEGYVPVGVPKPRSAIRFEQPYKQRMQQSVSTRMVFVGDGDVAKNAVRQKYSNPQIIALGYDELSGQTFGNKDFVLNAVNYLADDEGWMALRSRNYALRLLDKEKLGSQALLWKIVNVALPVLLVVMAGVAFVWMRKKRFGKG